MSGPKSAHANYAIEAVTPTNQDAYFVFQDNAGGGTTITGPLVIQGAGAALEINDSTGTAVVILEPDNGQVGNGRVAIQAGGAGGNAGSGGALIGLDNGGIALDYYSDATTTTYRVMETNPAQGNLILGASNAGSIVQIRGAAGLGQAYDSVNNRPQPGDEFLLTTFSNNFVQTPNAYTVAVSGWYVFNVYLNAEGVGFSWPANEAVTFRLLANGNEVPTSQASWWGLPVPSASGLEDNRDCLIQLTAGDVLTVGYIGVGTPNLGSEGLVQCYIQPLLAPPA
jgi:hypothetical protein